MATFGRQEFQDYFFARMIEIARASNDVMKPSNANSSDGSRYFPFGPLFASESIRQAASYNLSLTSFVIRISYRRASVARPSNWSNRVKSLRHHGLRRQRHRRRGRRRNSCAICGRRQCPQAVIASSVLTPKRQIL